MFESKNNYLYWAEITVGLAARLDRKVVLIDEENSLERILNEPTIFLANHTSTTDITNMNLAIQRSLRSHPMSHNRLIRGVSKDDNYNNHGQFIGDLVNFGLVLSGAIMTHPDDSKNPKKPPEGKSREEIKRTLANGSHPLILPMASVSVNGCVDYVRNENVRTFEYRVMARMLRGVSTDIHVHTMHSTIDPVHGVTVIRMGQRHRIKETPSYDYIEEISKCTTITGLQLYTLYDHISREQGLNLPQDISGRLLRLSGALQSDGYHVYNPRNNFGDVISYVEFNKTPHIITVEDKPINILDADYQLNQIKHLHLEKRVADFINSTRYEFHD